MFLSESKISFPQKSFPSSAWKENLIESGSGLCRQLRPMPKPGDVGQCHDGRLHPFERRVNNRSTTFNFSANHQLGAGWGILVTRVVWSGEPLATVEIWPDVGNW